jgi:hypothetical protein
LPSTIRFDSALLIFGGQTTSSIKAMTHGRSTSTAGRSGTAHRAGARHDGEPMGWPYIPSQDALVVHAVTARHSIYLRLLLSGTRPWSQLTPNGIPPNHKRRKGRDRQSSTSPSIAWSSSIRHWRHRYLDDRLTGVATGVEAVNTPRHSSPLRGGFDRESRPRSGRCIVQPSAAPATTGAVRRPGPFIAST